MKTNENFSQNVEQISPALAEKYLNTGNDTPIRESRIKKLVEIMRAGQWRFNGDAIKFDQNGDLINGHHILYAIIESRKTIEINVQRGLQIEAAKTVDSRNRSTADIANLNTDDDRLVIAIIRKELYSISRGHNTVIGPKNSNYYYYGRFDRNFWAKHFKEIYKENENLLDEVADFSKMTAAKNKLLTPASIGGLIFGLIKNFKYSKELVYEFFKIFGEISDRKNIIISRLINVLKKDKYSVRKMADDEKQAYILLAFNLYRTNCNDPNKLCFDRRNKYYYLFPWFDLHSPEELRFYCKYFTFYADLLKKRGQY